MPSFLYLPGPNELPAGSLQLPWDTGTATSPSASSPAAAAAWCRRGWSPRPSRGCATPASIATAPVLPWKAPEKGRRVSPLEASTLLSASIWPRPGTTRWPRTARESAGAAGHHVDGAGVVRRGGPGADRRGGPGGRVRAHDLLEEPQAAFYAWIDRPAATELAQAGRSRRRRAGLRRGRRHHRLDADRRRRGGRPAGADAAWPSAITSCWAATTWTWPWPTPWPATFAARRASSSTPGQMLMLWHSCRAAKEQLFGDAEPGQRAGDGAGPGQQGHRRHDQGRADPRAKWRSVLVDGFFPHCAGRRPAAAAARPSACRSWACPMPATRPSRKHLAWFLTRQPRCWPSASAAKARRRPRGRRRSCSTAASSRREPLRERMVEVLNEWASKAAASVKVLHERRPRPGRGARRGLLRPGAARQGRAHSRRHGPGLLCRHRDVAAGRARQPAAAQGAVRRARSAWRKGPRPTCPVRSSA